MAIDYQLVLDGAVGATQLVQWAFPEPADRAAFTGGAGMLGADLIDRFGFTATAMAGVPVHVDVSTDVGQWEWEPDPAARLVLRMDRETVVERGIPHLLAVTARVLGATRQDVALVGLADQLLLFREDGVIRKHHRASWWDHHRFADAALPG